MPVRIVGKISLGFFTGAKRPLSPDPPWQSSQPSGRRKPQNRLQLFKNAPRSGALTTMPLSRMPEAKIRHAATGVNSKCVQGEFAVEPRQRPGFSQIQLKGAVAFLESVAATSVVWNGPHAPKPLLRSDCVSAGLFRPSQRYVPALPKSTARNYALYSINGGAYRAHLDQKHFDDNRGKGRLLRKDWAQATFHIASFPDEELLWLRLKLFSRSCDRKTCADQV